MLTRFNLQDVFYTAVMTCVNSCNTEGSIYLCFTRRNFKDKQIQGNVVLYF